MVRRLAPNFSLSTTIRCVDAGPTCARYIQASREPPLQGISHQGSAAQRYLGGCIRRPRQFDDTYRRYSINHEQAFELLMGGAEKDTRVREWIQKRVDRRQDILMIVRTDTFVDSSVMAINGSGVSVQAEMSVSASQVVQGLQVHATQVGVDIGGRKSCEEANGYEAAGEMIFAVEYRKISWWWLPHADAVQGALGILIGSLRPGPWTRGGENDIAAFAEQSLVIKIEDKVPEFTETELEEEQLEIYCDKDGDDEIEYIFAVDEDKEIRDLDT